MEELETIQPHTDPFIVGVVSDTHVPDRVNGLHPYLLDELKARSVQLILHGGDISARSVLEQLALVAPVLAVSGNRDLLLRLPIARRIEIYGSQLVLTHGHISVATYWQDKAQHFVRGYDFERYFTRFESAYPGARVIVFGHTHHPENRWINGRLYFNPGSVSHGDRLLPAPGLGILKFYADGKIEPTLKPLTGAVIRNKKWEITR
jgi:phosphoesterase, MJ0936 family